MGEHAFLSDRRRSIVRGETAEEMGIADATYRQHRAAVKQQARTAMNELLEVATSPEIDNADVFEPDAVRNLVTALLAGSGGLEGDDVPPTVRAWDPDPDYANRVYVAVNKAMMNTHALTDDE